VVLGLALGSAQAEAGRRPELRGPPMAVPVDAVPFEPPPPPPPPAPPSAVSPLDGALVAPSLTGVEETLDLSRMARARVSWTFAVDHAWLGRLDDRALAGLIAACAADPAWRVVEEGGVLVAHRRVEDGQGWSVARTGFHAPAAPSGGVTWRVDLRFGAWPATSPWRTSPNVLRADAAATRLVVRAFTARAVETYGLRATALSVDGPKVAFDVYELGADDARATTVEALKSLATGVPTAAWSTAGRLADGRDVTDPPAEPAPPGITVAASGAQLDVRGSVNPGVPGWTWVRLVGPGGVWEEAVVGAGTRERIGWSADPARTFWLQGRFPVPPGPAFDATAEVWTAPDDGSGVRRVGAWAVRVPERGTSVTTGTTGTIGGGAGP
jgi:hypothetical protein